MHASRLHRLARSLREVALVATGNVGDEQVSTGELLVVEDVAEHPDSAIRDITARTGLAQSLVSRVVATMCEHAVFTSRRDPADRRRTLVTVAPQMRRELFRERGARPVDDALAGVVPNLRPAQVARLHRLLDEVADLFERGAPGG